MNMADEDLLWLRRPQERDQPPSRHAVLWPAMEYTALVFVPGAPSATKLDPFERAVAGAAANGVVEIRQQAAFLNLHEEFVAHLHARLVEREVLDRQGRYRDRADAPLTVQAPVAIRLYQDPWSGNLWPRFVTEAWRRALPFDAGVPVVVHVGTTGAPIEIRSFWVPRPPHQPNPPTSDDAREAVRTWTRLGRRVRVGGATIAPNSPIKLLPDSAQPVYLCCPNQRGRPGRPAVMDPFGGPTWVPFARALAERTNGGGPLARWLYGEDSESPDDPTTEAQSLQERIEALARDLRSASTRSGALSQVTRDLESAGHEAVDALWARGDVPVETLLLDSQTNLELIRQACAMAGFDPTDLPAGVDVTSALVGAVSLDHRCAALLLRFRSDVTSPLHHLSARCPDLFTLLRFRTFGESEEECATNMATAVIALCECAADPHVESVNGGVDRGEE